MKQTKLILLNFLILGLLSVTPIYGITPTLTVKPTATISAKPTDSLIDKLKKIENLKEKIATKVAQIRQNEKAVIFGKVKKIDSAKVTLETTKGDLSFNIAEDTTIYDLTKGARTESNAAKIKEGIYLSVFGYTDESKSVLSAKYIYLENPLFHLTGKVADLDKTNFTITLKTSEGENLVDIETTTKIFLYSPDKGLIKSGFSKFKTGDLVQLLAVPNPKEKDRYTGLKLVDLLPTSPTITPTLVKETSPTASPSAKSKITAKPSVKPSP